MQKIISLIFVLFPMFVFSQDTDHNKLNENFSNFRKQAKDFHKAGNFEKAIGCYDSALYLAPLHMEVLYAKAGVYLDKGGPLDSVAVIYDNLHTAILKLIEAEVFRSNYMEQLLTIHYERGMLYYAKKEYRKSVVYFKCLMELRTDQSFNRYDFEWITLLGNAHFALGEIDSAIFYYNKGFELIESDEVGMYIKADYYDLYYNGNHETYMNEFNKGIEGNPDLYGFYMYRGELRAMKNDFTGALEDFTKAVALQPTTHNWINKATMEWKIGNPEQAKKDFAFAMEINITEGNKESFVNKRNLKNSGYLEKYVIESTRLQITKLRK